MSMPALALVHRGRGVVGRFARLEFLSVRDAGVMRIRRSPVHQQFERLLGVRLPPGQHQQVRGEHLSSMLDNLGVGVQHFERRYFVPRLAPADAEQLGIEILNASPNSSIGLFRKVNISEVL